MDISILTELVNNVGFPIVVSGALFYQNFKNNETYNKTFHEFRQVIDQNNKSLEKLTDIVIKIKKDGE